MFAKVTTFSSREAVVLGVTLVHVDGVAARMILSRHTVDFRLRHIFRKLGIDSRVVLTRVTLANEERAS